MRRPTASGAESGKILTFLLFGLLVAAIAGTLFLQFEKQPETAPVSRGEKLAHDAGCFACHGRGDGEERYNLRQTTAGKWAPKVNPTLWDGSITEVAVLVDWITNGFPAAEAEAHKKLHVQMPAYKDRLEPDEIQAIAAWILAEGLKYTQGVGAKAPAAELADGKSLTGDALLIAGDRLSRKHGCYQCHGELGQGGVTNRDSFKGYIPGFFGKDFRLLTKNGDRDELRHWLDHGRGRDIESGLLGKVAKKYFDGQATQMPGYRDQLSAAEKEILIDFMLLLNEKGPLPAKEIETIVALLDQDSS